MWVMRGCCFVLWVFSLCDLVVGSLTSFSQMKRTRAITDNNIRQNLPAWIMLENVKHWSKCYFLFSVSPHSTTCPSGGYPATLTCLPSIKHWNSSTCNTRHLYHRPFFVQLFKNKSTLQSLFMLLLSFWLFLRKLAFKIFLHCLKKTRTD